MRQLNEAAEAYQKAAAALTAERQAAAAKLAKLAEAQINSLAMKVRFEVAVTSDNQETAWTAAGWDTVEYRIATNPGEPLKPLIEIASGGELSRVLLALKVALKRIHPKSARIQRRKPRRAPSSSTKSTSASEAAPPKPSARNSKPSAARQQVLCVTHLPQIAAFADQHLAVEKREKDGRTKTHIRVLDDRARTHEVARMFSGAKVTDTSLQHAAQMIAASR